MALPRACLTVGLDEASNARLKAACDPVLTLDRDSLFEHLAEAEGILCAATYPIDNEILEAAPRLRVISNFGVGYNNVDPDELTRRGVVVCNTPGVLNDAVADLTMGLLLALARRVVDNVGFVRKGDWSARTAALPLGFDLAGKTMGIVGYGRIGHTVAARARAFGMRIIYHDIVAFPSGEEAVPTTLDDLLRQSDVVSIHTNLTPQSTHLIGAREFSLMKPSAVLINTARGPVVDEPALVDALRSGRIAGAALDVIEAEPPPPDAPILSAPNVLIVPHIGSATVEAREAMRELCVSNLIALMRREPPLTCVNPEALERALSR